MDERTASEKARDVRGADDVSDGTSSASESSSGPSLPLKSAQEKSQKKRKTTYYHRKDEIEELQEQVKVLQEQLLEAQRTKMGANPLIGMDAKTLGAFYDLSIERNNLKLAGAQAMLSSYNLSVGSDTASIPLKTYIHLPEDQDERQNVLGAMKDAKLKSGYQFMLERTRGLDLRITQHQNEHFDFPNGDVAVIGFDLNHFDTGHSLRQVYEAFMYFTSNQEISISAELGVLTIRESEEARDCRFCQVRFLSSIPEGLEVESNAAMFTTFVGPLEESPAYGLGVVDFVDQDDLHPYRPDSCARQDMTGAVLLREVPNLLDANGRPVIAVLRWAYVRFRPPSFPVTKEVTTSARKRLTQPHEITFKVMREYLSTVDPAC